MKHFHVVWFALGAACAVTGQVPSATPTIASIGSERIIGTVNGIAVRYADLSSGVHSSLRDLDNDFGQRRMHLLWAGLEEQIDTLLLDAEAKRRGISAEALQKQEIDSKIEEPDQAFLRRYYDEHKDEIGKPFEEIGSELGEFFDRQRRQELERDLVTRLRQSAEITYDLPVADLPRNSVEDGDAPTAGPKDAAVTLIEFSDFECPFCAQARNVVEQLKALYPDSLRIVYRDFPLAQHPQAQPAAEAAQCAHEQGKFWPYHDLLFEHQDALGNDELMVYARQLNLDIDAFESCRVSERPKSAVRRHQKAGERYGVEGTPALFLNGIKLIGLLPLPLMQTLIDRELDAMR